MIEPIGSRLALLCAICLGAVGSLAIPAGAVSASTEVVYSNFNTVPPMVNGHPNTDTHSAYINYFPFRGMVMFKHSHDSLQSTLGSDRQLLLRARRIPV